MDNSVAFSLLVIVACATVIEAFPFNQFARSFSGGAMFPAPQQQYQRQVPRLRNNNEFFDDLASYRPHGNLNFGGQSADNGVGISVGGGERPQVSVGMGAVGGGVGADVEGEGKFYEVKMTS
ncbi:uncharacterized protein LOC135493635 isoform X2 [Lineus longissimus]|uniref:uncharacterized protein LOC135493635 isoform X2 n=1 Tax=Lineus longissimus TaxID=88925 RepID=UPI002B4EFD05